jgi:DNA polymerase
MLKRASLPGSSRARFRRKKNRSSVVSAITSKSNRLMEEPVAKSMSAKRLDALAKQIRVCVKCPLHASRTTAVPGEGKPTARVMIIGEAPGKQEDQSGRPFVGNAGRYLDHVLKGTEFERVDFFITNIVKCRPPSNRAPKAEEVETCTSTYLFEQIQLLNPKIILLLGTVAVRKMLGLKNVEEARGKIIEHAGRKYLASYHPAVRFYREDLAQKLKEDFGRLTGELKKL